MNSSISRQKLIMQISITILILVLLVMAIQDFYQVVQGTTNWVGKFTITWGIPLAGVMFFGLLTIVFGLINLWVPDRVESLRSVLARLRDRLGWLRWLLFVILALIPAKIFIYTPLGFKLTGGGFRFAFFLAVATAMALLVTQDQEKLIRWRPILKAFLFVGVVFAFAKEFVTVVDYPLSLTWSEGNRFWDYSWLYGRRLYDFPLDQRFEAYIDIGRQSLWGLPFLFDSVSILQMRAWSSLVLTVPYLLFGWIVLKSLPGKRQYWLWGGAFVFLFLYQGPIYTPLVLSAILVAAARRKPYWVALPLIFLAGYYAQLSRLTWMIAPAVWAILIAVFDGQTPSGERIRWQTWLRAVLYGAAGFLGGVGIQRGWTRISRQLGLGSEIQGSAPITAPTPAPEIVFTDTSDAVEAVSSGSSTFLSDQPLLWERLWPNPTNSLGIVFELLLVAVPLIILIIYLVKTKRWKLNLWQNLAVIGSLLGFLGIGVVISVKIGGGSNLHNLDMFLITLIFIAAIAWENGLQNLLENLEVQSKGIKILFLIMVMILAFLPMLEVIPLELPEQKYVDLTIDLLRDESKKVVSEGGEVLFMDQRQLLTFGVLDAPMVPEYEKKVVMDRALAEDREYFAPFYEDLANQRFSLIVTDPQRIRYSREEEQWAEENDAWVEWVTEPLYCFYEPKYSKDKTHVWFFVPRTDVSNCTFQP
ncbi:MAG: hypothetical protein ISR58_03355 [Anaerolineales bacterium]|nr:hypothetical protein [Chloroflexota bacterium]MBL6980209.1 hypothetical protein [Anaerolineales bacterium]